MAPDPIKYEQALDCVAALGEKALSTADAGLRDAVIKLITKLVGGFTDHVTVSGKSDWVTWAIFARASFTEHEQGGSFLQESVYQDGEVQLTLSHGLSGEVATRSRVPVSFELSSQLTFSASTDPDGSIVLSIRGLKSVPVPGATEAYKEISKEASWQGTTNLE